jgi:hypothetical protein
MRKFSDAELEGRFEGGFEGGFGFILNLELEKTAGW